MQTLILVWRDSILLLSFLACITGLFWLHNINQSQANDLEETEQVLFKMSFAYWMVYCVAFYIQNLPLPEWEIMVLSVKLTGALSYFLTFACVLCLPLHRFAVRQVEE